MEEKSREERDEGRSVHVDQFEVVLVSVGEDLEDDQAGESLPALEYCGILEPQH